MFFIIEHGKVRVTKQDGSLDAHKIVLKERAYFGEHALLTEEPRGATITAVGGEVRCLGLAREDFNRVIGPLKDILEFRRFARCHANLAAVAPP